MNLTHFSLSMPGAGSRRQKRSAPKEEPEKIDEEEWNLKDVIFVEDSRNMPIGRVIKVDGLHTVVHFPLGKKIILDFEIFFTIFFVTLQMILYLNLFFSQRKTKYYS